MRLVRVEISGFRRFRSDTKSRLEVDGPVIAIVGPNEAGKTSLLRALCRLDDDEPIGDRDRTRLAGVGDDHEILEALYLIEDVDRQVISDLYGAQDHTLTRWFVVHKYADGSREYEVLPGLVRDKTSQRAAVRELRRFASQRDRVAETASDDNSPPLGEIENVIQILAGDDEFLSDEQRDAIYRVRLALEDLGSEENPIQARAIEAARALELVLDDEARVHPNRTAAERLTDRRPSFLFFGDDQRDLHTDYDLVEVAADPPIALDNLVRLAGLDLAFLYNSIAAGDSGTAVDVLRTANERLADAFRAWSQGSTTVRLDREGDTLIRLHVSRTAGGFDRLDERSDGLRIFVSLLAVTARSRYPLPPIVVIDELERHLHYDAQADVVQQFTEQDDIPQIVYTTHSAGCLPEDLGAGIRVVRQVPDTNGSNILNRFWTTTGQEPNVGFTPLLFGMGAATLAFVPIRSAVLTEGATDLVLLPTLLREATGAKHIGFQVAPASAESPTAHIPGLSREAVRVAWLVDGDTAGGAIATSVSAQLGPDRLIRLGGAGSDRVLEDLLLPSVYAAAINAQLARSGVNERIGSERLSGVNSPRQLRAWCNELGVREPNKMDVANRVLDLRLDVPRLLSTEGERVLQRLSSEISAILGAGG